jgi:hypothetical protein
VACYGQLQQDTLAANRIHLDITFSDLPEIQNGSKNTFVGIAISGCVSYVGALSQGIYFVSETFLVGWFVLFGLHFPSYGSNTPIVHNRNMDILVHRLITDTALYSCYRSKHSNQHVTQNGILCGRTHPWLLLEWPQIFYMGWTGKTRVPTL